MLLINASLAAMDRKPGYGLVENGAVVIEGDAIAWSGEATDVPARYRNQETLDLEGRLVTPGLVDCHTHIVHGGNRAREFEMRLEGATYEEIARAGGGIVSTVAATRAADEESLLAGALVRVDALIAEGVTTIEIKSGYGLNIDTEMKMLRVARAVAKARPVRVRTSYLGAHAVPPEYKGRVDAYVGEVCIPALEQAHAEGLVDAVDGFCEGIAFQPEQIARVFDVARALAYAHALTDEAGQPLDIVNRDVSPGNIMVAFDGTVKLIDFGIAQTTIDVKSQIGAIKGKISYMAPEQVRGLPVDHRVDVFSLGTVLYEMLTGVQVFRDEGDFATMEKVRRAEAPPPSTHTPAVDALLDGIVARALAREASDRYPSADAMAASLKTFSASVLLFSRM